MASDPKVCGTCGSEWPNWMKIGCDPSPGRHNAFHDQPAQEPDDTLREIEELEAMWRNHGDNPSTRGIVMEALARIAREQTEKVWALEVNADEGSECSAELFALVCAVIDGKSEATKARARLEQHVEHVRTCRKGSCESELHGARVLRERAEKAEAHWKKVSDVLTRADADNARLREALAAERCPMDHAVLRANGKECEMCAAALRGGEEGK